MNMRTRILIPTMAVLVCSCTPTKPVAKSMNPDPAATTVTSDDPLEIGFQKLVGEIVAGLQNQRAKKIAVMQFQQLNGTVTEFGGFLAEEMITRLYRTGSFQVVEREMLNQVMAEHELAMSGLVDESTAKELGKLLGVDAIATGTITDFGSEVRVNSRLIDTETGSVFSAAATTLPKDERVRTLMSRTLVAGSGAGIPSASEPSSPGNSSGLSPTEPGLRAEYYNLPPNQRTIPASGAVFTRIDPSINQNWDTRRPVPRVNPDWFGVRWQGFIQIPQVGLYSLSFKHDDLLKVWVDGKVIYDRPSWTGGRFNSIDVTFDKSGWLPFKAEFVEITSGAHCVFRWALPGASDYVDVSPESFRH